MPYSDQSSNSGKSLKCIIAEAIAREWGLGDGGQSPPTLIAFIFDNHSHRFIMLNPKTRIWCHLDSHQAAVVVRAFIYSNSSYMRPESTVTRFYDQVVDHLKQFHSGNFVPVPGIMAQDKFLNFETGQAEEWKMEQYCFNYVDQPLNVDSPMDPEVMDFLKTLCNHDNLQLHVLRLFTKCTLLGVNPSQSMLFMIGPGLTGKSTFAKLLMSIMQNMSSTLDLASLPRESSCILGKKLLVFANTGPTGRTSNRASFMKSASC